MAQLLITLCDISAGVPGGLWVPHVAWYLTVAKVLLLGGALQVDLTPVEPVCAECQETEHGEQLCNGVCLCDGQGPALEGTQIWAGGQEALSAQSVSPWSLWLSPQFHGPRIGALYIRSPGTTTPLHPMLFGGGQERSFRPG